MHVVCILMLLSVRGMKSCFVARADECRLRPQKLVTGSVLETNLAKNFVIVQRTS